MFARIAAFELGYQVRNPVFWVVSTLFFLLTFGAVTIDGITIGGGGNVHLNSPAAIVQITQILSIFFMFVTTAFVANVVVRDDESGFAQIVRSTRVSRFSYLIGRFVGAYAIAAIAFLAVPLAIWIGSMMPWLDPELIGPNRLEYYAFAYGVLALPGLFLTASIFFAVATMTRSMMYSYVAVVGFLVLYLTSVTIIGNDPALQQIGALYEPFGIGAVQVATQYWTTAEQNSLLPPLEGTLAINRAIWLTVALLALVFAYWRFSFAEKGASQRKLRRQAKRADKLARVKPSVVAALPATRPEAARLNQFLAQMRLEARMVLRSPAFFVLMLIGLFNAGGGLLTANEIYGTPALPVTFSLMQTLTGTFAIIPIIIAIYYAGELVWRDRERKIHEIIDSTALPDWAQMLPKMVAVALVLTAALIISVVAAVLVQSIRGYTGYEFGKYFAWYVLPLAVDMLLVAVLAVFVQALSPNKYVGWAIMIVYLVASITLSNIGFEHPLYQYGATGLNPVSDLNADNLERSANWFLRLYWGGFALVLAVFSHLLWRRGSSDRLKPRLARMPSRLAGWPGAILAGGVAVAAVTGAYVFYNTNVLNEYVTEDDQEAILAYYEKRYLKYETLEQPSLSAIKLDVDLYPSEKRMEAKGRYDLINDTDAPIETLHVRFAPDNNVEIVDIDVPDATLELDDDTMHYRIYRFDRPMAPGEARRMTFQTRRYQRGFRARGQDQRLVQNGTFLDNGEFTPQIGMSRSGLLTDRTKRREHGLPPELRPAKLEDLSATDRNYVGNLDWVTSDITLSTDASQTPIAPGRKVSDKTEAGRRTARFVADEPILGFFSIQSAAYAEKSRTVDGVKISVFYDPAHAFNVDRMIDAAARALAYYKANFGPYQFDYLRIVEFPGYAQFAQAFAGTVPFSESIGFIADTSDPEAIDYPSYVTAHEVAHQYWAHQMISADMQGGTMLVETLAQYSALMVMKQLYGEDKIRRFLRYELDRYLQARGSEAIEELPLMRVEDQGYIHYRKGSLVMYLLQDRLGEDRVNAALREVLGKYRFKSQPYPRSIELVEAFKRQARTEEERRLISDLFEKITLYDLKGESATVTRLPDGNWQTELKVEAAKFHADGTGRETEAPLDMSVDVGLFDARPGFGAFDKSDVIAFERRPVKTGEQTIRLISKKRPAFAAIDPYSKFIDRNGDDNIVEVTAK